VLLRENVAMSAKRNQCGIMVVVVGYAEILNEKVKTGKLSSFRKLRIN